MTNQGWSIGAVFEYDYFWKGEQKSHLSDVDNSYSDLENTQKKGYGLKGSLKLTKHAEKIDFVIEPFIRYWNIERSDMTALRYTDIVIGYGYEPKNTTVESGVNFSAKF